ncbi:MAG: transposase [Clostridiales bacterium]|nr:transposase [Clostridiales bacterium]MBN2890454.1 transposase [Bacteroidales bacterium]
MKYSSRIKSSVLTKVLPPQNRSISEVARESGIADQTIYNWKKAVENGTLILNDVLSPKQLNQTEKLNLLVESRNISEENFGTWLRENGLKSDHLKLWQQEFITMENVNEKKYREENAKLKKENKALEKELLRKEKALAEMAALMTLKKKLENFWEEEGK